MLRLAAVALGMIFILLLTTKVCLMEHQYFRSAIGVDDMVWLAFESSTISRNLDSRRRYCVVPTQAAHTAWLTCRTKVNYCGYHALSTPPSLEVG